jgi:hypothetical protein
MQDEQRQPSPLGPSRANLLLREGALCAWFTVVALAFWGTSVLGLAFPAPVATATYGVFLLTSVAVTVLRLFRRADDETYETNDIPVAAASSAASPKEMARRGGSRKSRKKNTDSRRGSSVRE